MIRRKTKAGRFTSTVTKEEVEAVFHLPSAEAATQLGVGLTVLKRLCRGFGIERWPYLREKAAARSSAAAAAAAAQQQSPPRLGGPGAAAEGAPSTSGHSDALVDVECQGGLQRECSGGSGISAAGGYSQDLGSGPPPSAVGAGSSRGPPPPSPPQRQLGQRRHGARLLVAAAASPAASLPRPRLPAALLYDYLKEPSEEMGPPRQRAGRLKAPASPAAAAATAAATRAPAAAAAEGISPPQLKTTASLPVGWGEPVVVRTVTGLPQECIPSLGLARALSGSIARSSSMPASGAAAAAGTAAAGAVPGAAGSLPGHVGAGTQAAVVHGPAAGDAASWHGDMRVHSRRLVLPGAGSADQLGSLDTGNATPQQLLGQALQALPCQQAQRSQQGPAAAAAAALATEGAAALSPPQLHPTLPTGPGMLLTGDPMADFDDLDLDCLPLLSPHELGLLPSPAPPAAARDAAAASGSDGRMVTVLPAGPHSPF